ncbi:hypothetical protein BCR42DRAFT_405108 [Absidia repens]|uniref:BZIP domain-containing protein n=1 Tax=Absidia repens TaxID=90262 RepID=A0A1X2IX46_9FUNG|nr:hypothetical protein BCR42DRAFT_405108 [Absidia repens]
MNDSNTIYISHGDDISLDESSMLVPPSIDSTTLSKKVAQNRAAQRAFRERKQHYVEDLENKAKQLDEYKRAMIQLQADNECLRKSVTRLEAQLKQCIASGSTLSLTKPFLPPSSLQHPLLPAPSIPPPAPVPTPSPLLTNTLETPLSSSSSPPPSSSSSSSSPPPPLPSSIIHQNKPTKREKKRQRLLAEEKLHKNDDLEPIQLHSPLSASYQQYQQQHQTMTQLHPKDNPISPTSSFPMSSSNNSESNQHPLRFLQLLPTTTMDDAHDPYIHFVNDNQHPTSQ